MYYSINCLQRDAKLTRFCGVFGIRLNFGETLACARHLLAPTTSEAKWEGNRLLVGRGEFGRVR